MPDIETDRQCEALRRLAMASQEIRRLAESIHGEMAHIVHCIDEGQHMPTFSNQQPFDLARAFQQREDAIHMSKVLGVPSAVIEMASTGEWTT